MNQFHNPRPDNNVSLWEAHNSGMRARSGTLFDSRALRYAIAFAALSILFEVVLLVLTPLRIPEDDLAIAPAVLIAAPPAAAAVSGFRGARLLLRLLFFTAALTLALSVTLGAATGLLAPLLIRPAAGFAAAATCLHLERRAARKTPA